MHLTSDQFLTIILSIVIIEYLLTTIVDWLNLKKKKGSAKEGVPDKLKDVYDQEKYQKALNYQRENTHFGLFSGFVSFCIVLAVLIFGVFGMLDGFVREHFSELVPQTLVFSE